MRADLHLHSTASDGELSPREVVATGASRGLTLLALTDHDSVAGVGEASATARELGVALVSGVECSSTRQGREIHILGYGVDPTHPAMVGHGDRARSRRRERMSVMIGRLARAGLAIGLADVEVEAGSSRTMLGRPHLARALLRAGYVSSVDEAFGRWIGDGHPAFVPTDLGPPEEAIATIRSAGGVPVWAHPPLHVLPQWLPELVDAGLQGLEAYRPAWSSGRRHRVARLAREHGLCTTGGSDWHGPGRGGRLGEFWLTEAQLGGFLELLGDRSPGARRGD